MEIQIGMQNPLEMLLHPRVTILQAQHYHHHPQRWRLFMVMPEQRNHRSGGRSKLSGPHFSSPPPSRGFRGMNCRHSTLVSGRASSHPHFPPAHTPSPEPNTPKQHHISISPSTSPPSRAELWAGPAFSNSPSPSSLPIPKFSLRQKCSVSLELPPAERCDDVEVRPHAKSAPSSPMGGSRFDFFNDKDTAIATENLRRILQLDIADS